MPGTTGTALALFNTDDVEAKDKESMVRLPASLWKRLSEIAELEDERVRAAKPDAKKVSRNDVIKKVLADFVETYVSDKKLGTKRGH